MFKTKGRRGLNAKQITVFSNDPENSRSSLLVRATLEFALGLEPLRASFGNVGRGEASTQSVALIGRDAAKTKILSIEVLQLRIGRTPVDDPGKLITARAREGAEPGIDVSIGKDAPQGRFFATMRVTTDHPDEPTMTLQATGVVRPDMILRPARVLFRDTGQPKPLVYSVMITSTTGAPVEVLGVKVDHPALAATYKSIAPNKAQIDVTLSGTVEGTHEKAIVRVHTSSGGTPLIEIPVEIYRTQRRPATPAAGSE